MEVLEMSCPCDPHTCRGPLAIAAGLNHLPRALASFPAWRSEILAAVGRETALADWRARESGDLGLMLLEMAAYVLDVASFYDQLVANESYLATASLSGTQRRLVSLLGYLPRPAIGSSVWLAAEVDGPRLIQVPAGTAFRSGAFQGQPPQVFELEQEATLEPRLNRYEVERVAATSLPPSLPGVLVKPSSCRVSGGKLLLLNANGTLLTTKVASTEAKAQRSRQPGTLISFSSPLSPPASATYRNSQLLTPGASCGAWKRAPVGAEPPVLASSELSLDTRIALQAGDIVAVSDGNTTVARRLSAVSEVLYTVIEALTSTITAADKKVSTLLSPPIKVAVTRLRFDATLPFTSSASLVVHYAMVPAADLLAPLKDTLAQGDPLFLLGFQDAPRLAASQLLLEDGHGDGVATTGTLDASAQCATPATAPAWGLELWAPVQLFANVIPASRGESVTGELLGVGDGSQAHQSFRLKKKPLTYLPAANASGRRSTLVIHVAGSRWREVENFYGVDEQETVYIVRHDEEGNTDVQFGGGARLPSGAQVLADYRFGAGAQLPPADSVKQLVRPVAGLRRVHNVLPAYGGADAESAAELALRGPRSALLLGRAISLLDIETAASLQPGVRAAKASWRWDPGGLRPAVSVRYIGDDQLAPVIRAVLRALAEEDAPIAVLSAPAQPARLDLAINIDPRQVPQQVIAAVGTALFSPATLPGTGGLLRPERLGPDGVVIQSAVVRAVMEVPGVASLSSLDVDGTPFVEIGRKPTAGAYFDFAAGGVWINGERA
jgi:hypothetical protein